MMPVVRDATRRTLPWRDRLIVVYDHPDRKVSYDKALRALDG